MFSNKTTFDASTKIWSGEENKPNAVGRYPSLGRDIFEYLTNNPDNVVQISDTDGIKLTNKQLLTMSIQIAQRLKVDEGSIIGIAANSSTYQAGVIVAAFMKGIVFHPFSCDFDQKTTQHVLGITRPSIIFCDANNYNTLMAACKEIDLKPKVYTIKGKVDGIECVHDLIGPTGNEDDFRPIDCGENETVTILGSSGTTGLPKGVCMSSNALRGYIITLPDDCVIFACCNIDWITGLAFLLFSLLNNVTRIITEEEFSPKYMRQLIEKHKLTIVMMSGACLSRFVKSGESELCDLSSVKLFAVGGGNVSHPMYVKMQECLKDGIVMNAYGATEFGGVSVSSKIEKEKNVGQINAEVKVRIIDEDGNNLGIGESGEILVKNRNPWKGYYGDPKQTQNIIDFDGWFHTGDIGYFDEDGDLHLVDRKKEIMKYRGFHYSAQEIENCILGLSGIAEVCVFGTIVDEYGDLATAAVVRKAGSSITETDIKEHVAKEFTHAMWLHGGVYFVDKIVKTHSGKYPRSKIRDMCLKNNNK